LRFSRCAFSARFRRAAGQSILDEKMTKGSQREYADHLECSESYVSRLKRQGRLVFDADGLVDFAASDALVAASRDPDKEGVSERWRIEKGSAAADIAAASAGARKGSVAAAGVLADAPLREGEIPARAADPASTNTASAGKSAAGRAGNDGPAPAAVNRNTSGPSTSAVRAEAAGANTGQTHDEPRAAGELPLDAPDLPGGDASTDAQPGRTAEDRLLYRRRLQAQAGAAEYDQAMKEIELHERAGSLMRVSDARDRMYAYGRHVRDVWQSLESRMTPALSAEQLATLRTEIKATLHELERRVAAESRVKREAGITEPA
jgi:hypothetical protein